MQQRTRLVVVAFALASLLGTAAHADETVAYEPLLVGGQELRGDIGLLLGYNVIDQNSGLGNSYYPDDVPGSAMMYGLRAGALWGPSVGLEGEFKMAPSEFGRFDGGSVLVSGWRVLARYILLPDMALRPFVLIGIGQEMESSDKRYGADAGALAGEPQVEPFETDLAMHVGLGGQYKLTHRLSARLDLRYVVSEPRPASEGETADYGASHNFEATAGLSWTLGGPPADSDSDGIGDDRDKCPDEAEDKDGFEDSDGCPDTDNDGDGVADTDDKCPNEAEDKDGFEDADGCPDLDNDGDGVPDAADECPADAEDADGFEDADGCPDLDNDKDGLADAKDKCPNEAEDKDGFQDSDGCPDPDNDGDGVPDAKDKCLDKPETKNGFQDDDGCPDEMPEAVTALIGAPIDGLVFKADALDASRSKESLERWLVVLLENDGIGWELHCHVHPSGDPAADKALSLARCVSLQTYLVENLIDAKRLRVVGDGSEKPLATGNGGKAKKKNARVELQVF